MGFIRVILKVALLKTLVRNLACYYRLDRSRLL